MFFVSSTISVFTTWYGASLSGAKNYASNPILELCFGTFLHTRSDDNQTRLQHTTRTHYKHHHYGDGTTNPSGGVDLMNSRHPRGGQPYAHFF